MRVSIFVGVSIDGYIAEPGGHLDFLKPFEGVDFGYATFVDSIDTVVIGRGTYETAIGFPQWPWDGKRVIVVTHRPLQSGHGETVFAGNLRQLAEQLATDGAQSVYFDGGSIIQQALFLGLIDSMTITRVPITLGAGVPLFAPNLLQPTCWKLVGLRGHASGMVQEQYEKEP